MSILTSDNRYKHSLFTKRATYQTILVAQQHLSMWPNLRIVITTNNRRKKPHKVWQKLLSYFVALFRLWIFLKINIIFCQGFLPWTVFSQYTRNIRLQDSQILAIIIYVCLPLLFRVPPTPAYGPYSYSRESYTTNMLNMSINFTNQDRLV